MCDVRLSYCLLNVFICSSHFPSGGRYLSLQLWYLARSRGGEPRWGTEPLGEAHFAGERKINVVTHICVVLLYWDLSERVGYIKSVIVIASQIQ